MESFEDSNCHSSSFSLYERYLRSFNVVDPLFEENINRDHNEHVIQESNADSSSSCSRSNIELSIVTPNIIDKHSAPPEIPLSLLNQVCCEQMCDKNSSLDTDCDKLHSPSTPLAGSLLETSIERSLIIEKSNQTDVQASSEESKIETIKHPVFITPTMENSNNAMDSVPMFRQVRTTDSVFKLPISELSFNGTLKQVQKMKPIVDPITALNSSAVLVNSEDKPVEDRPFASTCSSNNTIEASTSLSRASSISDVSNRLDKVTESTGDSYYDLKKEYHNENEDISTTKWSSEQSYSSFEASYDSGVRSPDLFDEDDEEFVPEVEPFWNFLKDYEMHDKHRVRKMEERLHGILPPPSVTMVKADVTQILNKYYSFLPLFKKNVKVDPQNVNTTPTKKVSFIEIPEPSAEIQDTCDTKSLCAAEPRAVSHNSSLDTSAQDKSINLKMCSETDAKEMPWPDLIKCKHYDVYYNVTKHSEKLELLALRYAERFVGAETETSVCVYSGGMQSPSSAVKRKELRLKMAQGKSPGRRLSHLARRRQAFASAATIGERAQSSTSKMILIDKNFFQHRKLINSSLVRKSPHTRRTPGKKTPVRKTPGKKTPSKTPKTRSGGSSKKKAMRRLLMDSDQITRSQPPRESLKRALFVSPEHRKPMPAVPSSSVPVQAMKSKRNLFGSPVRTADTKSLDGTQSDHFLKRKRDLFEDEPPSNRSKIAKSLSFGGDNIGTSNCNELSRRNSEAFMKRKSELTDQHKKKLLWAVSEALRVHGWRMSSPGFREKASALAQLTRRLLTLPPHAARLAQPQLSTSETMLKIARRYVFAVIQGRSLDECFAEEQQRLENETKNKVTGYISASAYQQLQARQNQPTTTFASQIKENTFMNGFKQQDQPKSTSKNVLQDKLVNVDNNSNSSSGLSMFDKPGLYQSNSMPSFEEAAKMRARRQISFDNIDFPKR